LGKQAKRLFGRNPEDTSRKRLEIGIEILPEYFFDKRHSLTRFSLAFGEFPRSVVKSKRSERHIKNRYRTGDIAWDRGTVSLGIYGETSQQPGVQRAVAGEHIQQGPVADYRNYQDPPGDCVYRFVGVLARLYGNCYFNNSIHNDLSFDYFFQENSKGLSTYRKRVFN
jgi:hypothetical protein